MKNLKISLIVIIGLLVFTSCDKGEVGPVMSSTPGSPSITAPQSGQSYMLTEDQADDTLMTMKWTEPDYGFTAAPDYIVEMGMAGQDFANATQLATINRTSYSITVGAMNGMLLGAGLPFGEESSLEFRVIASVADSAGRQVSEAVVLSFTPYSICQYCPEIYVPGGYQSVSGYTNDWSPADAPALATLDDQDQYEGYVYINDANSQFKFTAERNWNNGDWGDTGADGTLDAGGDNIIASGAGYYKINVDLNALTYSLTNTDWGVIGDATAGGWDADQDMTYNPDTKIWTITTDLAAGEMKFRANDAWDLNYGDNEGDGILEAGGGNIVVGQAGNYTIELNLSGLPYTYSLTQN